ncbi:SDR family NAD(P)-dependent oxidoreductase [Legionella brunensis]|uniref:NADP-dependent L-serine/L-allo-threonine dehydrogenase ydfG n=1 Tax=Legionella brunensis TaxID=29422 RepID=A0A0W0STY5_9GAMM|nr:SDR family NAD(P)-dependent oxidoreductase [Legionella brunensis]KTC86816.1 NADP-dependent L-serine/L-allo-threonine dehydrogenase ydfG [Legionella brunensis]
MQNMTNKIVLITGASSGIGEACARLFASNGAKLILCARRQDRIESLAKELKSLYGTTSLPLQLDVRVRENVESTLGSLPGEWQFIHVLINNAGLALSSDPIQKGSFENWDTMIDTNVKGLLYVSRTLLPGMIQRNQGHIINIGSIAGQECYPAGNVYCATKHAVRAITKSMRLDLLGTPIRITEIAPGAVETEFSEVRWGNKEKAKAFYQDFNPLLAADIADAAYYCATRPGHMDIAEMTIMPTVQASANHIHRGDK